MIMLLKGSRLWYDYGIIGIETCHCLKDSNPIPSANRVFPILCSKVCNMCRNWTYWPICAISAISAIFVKVLYTIIAQIIGDLSLKCIAQKYCSFLALCIAYNCVQYIQGLLICILHSIILPNCLYCTECSYCTYWSIIPVLLHRIIHNKVDQFCCSLHFTPAARLLAAACVLLIAALYTMLLFMQLLADLTFQSTITRIYYEQPGRRRRQQQRRRGHLQLSAKWGIKTTLIKNGNRENKLIRKKTCPSSSLIWFSWTNYAGIPQ